MQVHISDDELEQIYQFAIQLGRNAGKLLLGALEDRRNAALSEDVEHEQKLNAVDIVTQTDQG